MLEDVPPDLRWLGAQTVATAPARRQLLGLLPLAAGGRVLDVGCGLGAAGVELAALRAHDVVGVDRDPRALAAAERLAGAVGAAGALAVGSRVTFLEGDAYRLPFDPASYDAAVARFVFQHLDRPADAAAELARVLRPGGVACVIDVDDALSISEPPPSASFRRLADALRAAQHHGGGDRHVGRRLPGLLDGAGLVPTAVLVLPHAGYHRAGPDDPARQLLLERFRAARGAVVDAGIADAETFDADLARFAAEPAGAVCEIEAHLAVIAERRR